MRPAILALSIGGLLAMAASSEAASATIRGPRTAEIGDRVTVSARGLIKGGYALTLVSDSHITNGGSCVARLSATAATKAGAVTLRGTVPAKLTCYQAASINLGRVATAIGGYHLVVAEPSAPDGFDTKGSFVRSALRITG
jgi:hypothetical protein